MENEKNITPEGEGDFTFAPETPEEQSEVKQEIAETDGRTTQGERNPSSEPGGSGQEMVDAAKADALVESLQDSENGAEQYTSTPIEWPSEIPDKIKEYLPKELRQGPDVKSTIQFTKDAEGRIVGAHFRSEDSSKDASMPEVEEVSLVFDYDRKGRLTKVDMQEENQMLEFSGGAAYDYAPQDSKKMTLDVKYYRFGAHEGMIKDVSIKRS